MRFCRDSTLTLVLATCLLSNVCSQLARADEVWVCRFPNEPAQTGATVTRYWLHQQKLEEMEQPYRFYNIIYQNDVGIAAAWGEATPAMVPGLPEEGISKIGVESFAIDRKNGDAIKGFIEVSHTARPAEQGTCHPQNRQEPGAVWPPGFR